MKKPFIEKEDYYFNEEGLMVLTAKYLSERGFCCGNGCRHCPYDYENVADPEKTRLLLLKQDSESDKTNS